MKSEDYIFNALDRVYKNLDKQKTLSLDGAEKYVIFSDHHKGAKNGADNFMPCEKTYLQALDYYLKNDYNLIILGDAEEQQQESTDKILLSYKEVMAKEVAFHKKGKYHKVFGNHDYKWSKEEYVQKYLEPLFPGIKVNEGLLLKFTHPKTKETGNIMLTHGHQGTFNADRILFWAAIGVRVYKYWQMFTGKGTTKPSANYRLRAQHDRTMYTWASRKTNFVLITGHTHRPIWSSKTHIQKLTARLWKSKKKMIEFLNSRGNFKLSTFDHLHQEISYLETEIKKRIQKYDDTNTIKSLPTYFNTGCCRYVDGDITGVEIEDQKIRLIKWNGANKSMPFKRTKLEEDDLMNLFNDFDLKKLLAANKQLRKESMDSATH